MAKGFSLGQNVHIGPRTNTSFIFMGFPAVKLFGRVKLTTLLHLHQ